MKGTLRIIKVDGLIMKSYIIEDQDASLSSGVQILLSVDAEASPRELLQKLNSLATEKADELKIKLPYNLH